MQPHGPVFGQLTAHEIGRERDKPGPGVETGDLALDPGQPPHAREQHHPGPRRAFLGAGKEGVAVNAIGLVARVQRNDFVTVPATVSTVLFRLCHDLIPLMYDLAPVCPTPRPRSKLRAEAASVLETPPHRDILSPVWPHREERPKTRGGRTGHRH